MNSQSYTAGFAQVSYQNKGLSTIVARSIPAELAYTYPPRSGIGSLRVIKVWLPGCKQPLFVDHTGRVYAMLNGEYTNFIGYIERRRAA